MGRRGDAMRGIVRPCRVVRSYAKASKTRAFRLGGGRVARFTGKVAIVTGGGSGIGRATARLLAAEGAAVTVADLRADSADAVVAEIDAAGGRARSPVVGGADGAPGEALGAGTRAAVRGPCRLPHTP